jgi:DNA-binding sugar fermentation-stimulating protein
VLAYSLEIGLRHLLDLLDSFEMNQRETQLVLEQINQVTKGLVSKSVDKRYPEALYDSVNSEELEDILSQCEELLGPKRAMVLASARQVLFPFD